MLMSSAIRKIKGLPKSIIKSVDRKEGLTGESFTYSNAKQRLTEFDKDMKKQNSTLSSNSSDDEYSDEINDTDNKNLHVVSDKIIIETCNENDKVPSVNNDFQFKRFGSR